MGSTIPNEIEADLAIIGGGPTGLLTGLLAEGLGISVCIIDSKPQTLEIGRADALNARSQQYLEVAGVLEELLPQGITCNTSSTFSDGAFKSRQNAWWAGLEHCYRKNFLMIGQPVVEKAIASRLRAPVYHNESLVKITENEHGVTAETSTGRVIRSKYAVGADGAKSTVRTAIGIPFTGTKPEMVWAVLDTFIDTDFPVCSEIITFQLNGESRVSWIPRERGMARFYVLLQGEITQRKTEDSIRQHLAPHRVDFKKTEWFSTFEIKERLASAFVSRNGSGRVILAGDAAHVHSVNGGQGLNTGIADAFGLAWRLATIISDKGLPVDSVIKLVKSYDIERRGVAGGVIDVAATLVRDTLHTAKQYVSTIQKNAAYITGMGVKYEGLGSPLIRESTNDIFVAGRRCPDIELTFADGETKRLYSMLDYGKHLILSIGPQNDNTLPWHEVMGRTDFYHITTASQMRKEGSGESQVAKTVTASALGELVESYVVYMRPDTYVGFVGSSAECRKHLAYLSKTAST